MAKNKAEKKLRVWWKPQIPMDASFYVSVKTPEEAKKILDILADYDAFQFNEKIKPDYSNAGGLEELNDGEWTDWYSEDGEDIDEVEF
jgi:hypothetical protein